MTDEKGYPININTIISQAAFERALQAFNQRILAEKADAETARLRILDQDFDVALTVERLQQLRRELAGVIESHLLVSNGTAQQIATEIEKTIIPFSTVAEALPPKPDPKAEARARSRADVRQKRKDIMKRRKAF